MNKITFALACLTVCLSACAGDTVIRTEQLPEKVQSFISTHFAGATIVRAEMDKKSYEVKLSNGYEIDFCKKGCWKDVDCKRSAVPESVIALLPATIGQYITTNYPGTFAVEVGKDRTGFEIELNNGVDLDFSAKGEFVKADR